jgi:peptidoglycan-N-acetylglucosamine deacetylase
MKKWAILICITSIILSSCGGMQLYKARMQTQPQELKQQQVQGKQEMLHQQTVPIVETEQKPSPQQPLPIVQKPQQQPQQAVQIMPKIPANLNIQSNNEDSNRQNSKTAAVRNLPNRSIEQSAPKVNGTLDAKPRSLSLADLRRKYPATFKLYGQPNRRQVALTFDDGPDLEFTPQILDVLKRNHVRATFFLLGNRAKTHPEMVRRILREGHQIGNHSYNHPLFPKISDLEFRRQVEQTQTVLKSIIGYSPRFIRPPYGAINEKQIKWLATQKYTVVNWNVDSLDWKGLKSEQVLKNVMRRARPGSIILQHCAGGRGEDLSGTVKALPKIISQLRAEGVDFVTVAELFSISSKK